MEKFTTPSYRGQVSKDVEKTLDIIVQYLGTLTERLEESKGESRRGIEDVRRETASFAGLLGARGQRLIGETATDPLLEQVGTGQGTVTSVNISASGNLSASGGPVTTSGGITVSLTANPSFTTVDVSTEYRKSTVKVVGARKTGWGSPAGTLSRAAYTAYAGQTVSAGYVQAEVQALDDAVQLLARVVAALLTDLHGATSGHGLIGT